MTRINCVDVSHLTDKHLLAEYREITRPFGKVGKRLASGSMPRIPEHYCLGAGHETFFFNKLAYLHRRYWSLYSELLRRGVAVDKQLFSTIEQDMQKYADTELWKSWTPRPADLYLNMARLCKRSGIQSVDYELTTGW